MNTEIIVAILSCVGTACGSIVGIMTANKLTNYRIEKLEEQVKKHNNVIERVYKLEEKDAIHDEQLKVVNHRIQDLKKGVHKDERKTE